MMAMGGMSKMTSAIMKTPHGPHHRRCRQQFVEVDDEMLGIAWWSIIAPASIARRFVGLIQPRFDPESI